MAWQDDVWAVLKEQEIRQVAYVPDAGHSLLIRKAHADPAVAATVLTTEEEGVALCSGAWLGGDRSVLLMQSSGVGNCINMLSMIETLKIPFLTLVTMRGDYAEFNPWQIPMGKATETVLAAMGLLVRSVERPEDAADMVDSAARLAFHSHQGVAVLLRQRLIGRKDF